MPLKICDLIQDALILLSQQLQAWGLGGYEHLSPISYFFREQVFPHLPKAWINLYV